MGLFPLEIYKIEMYRHPWFRKWYTDNRKMLAEKYGSYFYTGNPERDREKQFSSYEQSAIFTSPTEVVIRFYGMGSSVYGGRGSLICKVESTVETDDSIREMIKNHMRDLATIEYDVREEARLIAIRKAGIDIVEQELFANFKI
jgi:uncharacterized protein Veg